MPYDQLLVSPSILTIGPGEIVQLVSTSDMIPVLSEVVTTAHGGVAVALPDTFIAEISAASDYTVSITKQTYLTGGGEVVPANKTTTGFDVVNKGSVHGEQVLVQVWRV